MCRAVYSGYDAPVAAARLPLRRPFSSWPALPAAAVRLSRNGPIPLRGQILSVGEARPDGRRELSVKHEDIPGFMPAMSMAYFVKTPPCSTGWPRATSSPPRWCSTGGDIHLDAIKKTGHADLPPDSRPVKVMDVMEPGDEVPDDPLQDQAGADPQAVGLAGPGPGRHVRVHTMSIAGLLPADGSAVRRCCSAPSPRDPRLRDRAHLVSVSFDPAHDTADVIRAHAKARGADPQHVELPHGIAGRHRSVHVAIRRLHNRRQGRRRRASPTTCAPPSSIRRAGW